ncbi:MAG: hypothetical protein M3Y56_04580 [Armatimonadota bacterium]|nr:hypothetical protein [Armatimonadota bacterium]
MMKDTNTIQARLRQAALLSFLVLITASLPAHAGPTLTQPQAVQIASTFCQTIGSPITDPGVAVFPAPSSGSGLPDSYYLPRWQVKFGHKAVVEVVDATGLVSRYYNYDLSHRAMLNNGAAGTPITQDAATTTANAVIQAGTGASELGTPQAQEVQLANPATSSGHLWMINFPRMFNTVPYRRQGASVVLQAETGAVQGYSLNFLTPMPAATNLSVTHDTAIATAQGQLTTSNIGGTILAAAQQEVVQPNTFWVQGGSPLPQPGAAPRVAWDCSYVNATQDGIYQVWVDAETGQVIGGITMQKQGLHLRPLGPPKPRSLSTPKNK